MPKVSIIVPIYNAEKFLNKCIDSLINQTYSNLEIILINDGSKDKSWEIIKSYQDKRIVAINKDNTGVGSTRNLGIEKSTGTYLMFIDSDDFIELECVEKLVKKAIDSDCDLVIADYYLDASKTYEIKFPRYSDTNLKKNPELLTKINLGPCNKLYYKNLFKKSYNRFIENLKYEDTPVVVEVLRDAKKIGFIPECLFHYVMQKTGETITRDERIFDIISICKIIETKLAGYNYLDKTDLIVKILTPYLKNSRYINDQKLRNKFLDAVFNYLNEVDLKWRKCSFLKKEDFLKKIIIIHKNLLKIVNKFYV